MFQNVKGERIQTGLRYIIVSWFGWVVNQECYGMVDLSTDCSIISENTKEQAGAEQCQAQMKLGLVS